MNFRHISRELNEICHRFSDLLIDVNHCAVGTSITWSNYISGIHNHVNYYYEYRWMIDYRQFSLLLDDGGALQFYYSFENDELRFSRQCYYPPPLDKVGDLREIDVEISLDDMLWVNIEADDTPSQYRAKHWSHIRLDFDSTATTHDPSHLQYSAVNSFRIPSDKVLSPFVFLDMVLRDFYPREHANYAAQAWYRGLLKRSARQGLASAVGRADAVRISCP
jgi:hypothetical protein